MLKYKVIVSCFFEVFICICFFFEIFMYCLGVSVVGFFDSVNILLGKKGEMLVDIILVISIYVDVIVMCYL